MKGRRDRDGKPLISKKFLGKAVRGMVAVGTGGASELALAVLKPGRVFPQRRQQGRVAHGIHPDQHPHARPPRPHVPGHRPGPPRRPPIPAPPGRLYPQRRFTARAKAGLYRHLRQEDMG